MYPNGLTNSTEIWNQDFLGDDASFSVKNYILSIGLCNFQILKKKKKILAPHYLEYCENNIENLGTQNVKWVCSSNMKLIFYNKID